LREQLAFLRQQGWRLLGLTDALSYLHSDGSDRVACLTFDGGLLDFLNAWRVLNDVGASATLYVPVESVGLRTGLWDRDFSRLGWTHLNNLSEAGIELGIQLAVCYRLDNIRVVDKLAVDKERLQGLAKGTVSSFCLDAKRTRMSASVRHALTRAGYDTACLLRRGVARSGGDPFSIPRISIKMNASGEAVHELLRKEASPRVHSREAVRGLIDLIKAM
jgi:hypothetical protein